MTNSPSEISDENQEQLDNWDPDKARIKGTLKAPIAFKTDVTDVDIPVEFGEPEPAKTESKKAKVVSIGKRNKNSLF